MKQRIITAISGRCNSLQYAADGIVRALYSEINMRVHFIATIVVVIAGLCKGLLAWQWVALTIVMGMVWMAEMINTALEILCNLVCDNRFHPTVKMIKDISAGAVLVTAIVSIITGIFVFTF